jgi:hypothetical protein
MYVERKLSTAAEQNAKSAQSLKPTLPDVAGNRTKPAARGNTPRTLQSADW